MCRCQTLDTASIKSVGATEVSWALSFENNHMCWYQTLDMASIISVGATEVSWALSLC